MPIALATCGTALTSSHIITMHRYTDQLYLLFDNDNAGSLATLRALGVAYSQGLYPKVVDLKIYTQENTEKLSDEPQQQAKDIDDFVLEHQDAQVQLGLLLDQAQDGFVRAIRYFQSLHNDQSPLERQKLMQGLFELVYASPIMSTQTLFLEQIAQSLRLDNSLVMTQYRQYVKKEKKLFRPRQSQDKKMQDLIQQRQSEKNILIAALLTQEFWKAF